MFKSLLSRVPERAEGVRGIALVSLDGIAIEKIQSDPDLNLDTLIAEFTDRMKKTLSAAEEMGVGTTHEIVAWTSDAVIILRAVHEEYYILCATKPDGMHGVARHAIRTILPDMTQELIW